MAYIGDFRLESTFDLKFTTIANSTGAPTILDGSPVISAYVGNSTTQITAGITLTVDFDGVTGLNNVRVVATGANGYATASNYQLVITTGTVGGTSVVGYVVGQFSIENRSALMPTVAARTLDVSAGGEGGVDWANIGSPTTANNLSATNIDVDQIVASVSGAVGSVTGAVGSVTGSVGSVVGAVGSVTGAVGSVTGNVGGNVVGSVASVTAAVTVGTNNDKTGYSLLNPVALKKNTALTAFMFLMLDSTDHVTPKTGLTVTATRSLDGAAFAACANAVSEVSNGWYKLNLDATDTNANVIAFKFTATGADATNMLAVTNT